MSVETDVYEEALATASRHARHWLASVGTRRVGPAASADEIAEKLGGPLPTQAAPPQEVIELLPEA